MTNEILRTSLNKNHTLCQKLDFNVFVEEGYEIDSWIERNSDKRHIELDEIFDKKKNQIEQRLKVNFSSKFLAGVKKLKEVNANNLKLLGLNN